jgi:predicted transcriptional regulator of viral defense system
LEEVRRVPKSADLASKVLAELASDRRRITSRWRLLVLARQIAVRERKPLPTLPDGRRITQTLMRRGAIEPWGVPGLRGIFAVSAPYADLLPLNEEQILQEANPSGYFCFLTALLRHGLTKELPKHLNMASVDPYVRPPLGTREDDWVELNRPAPQTPNAVGHVPVIWAPKRAVSNVGVGVFPTTGGLLYMSDLEKTLLDALQYPELCLGITNVLRAWRAAPIRWDLANLVAHVRALKAGPVMRQRVGYLIEAVGGRHPAVDEWREHLERGGSLKLVASNPYSPVFSERWNLSLNVPPSALGELTAE